jgi:hypothetical protein
MEEKMVYYTPHFVLLVMEDIYMYFNLYKDAPNGFLLPLTILSGLLPLVVIESELTSIPNRLR